jgi:hypothetical protein
MRPFEANTGFLRADVVAWAEGSARGRKELVWLMQHDLFNVAIDLGQTDQQAIAKVDDLFSAFAAEWSIYALTGSEAIVAAIENDATLPWLDTEYPSASGVTIRTRLINRLNNG